MATDISPTTGEAYYSGSWTDIQNVLRVLNIGEGKMAKVTESLVAFYQEMVDRDIDEILIELYHVPLRAMNQVQPDGTTKRVFPGSVRRSARYWAAGLLLLNEFQNLAQNITEQAQAYVEDSKKEIFAISVYNHRLVGQRRKSNLSRTVPPNFQPPHFVEANF
jgi:hypothetical protein